MQRIIAGGTGLIGQRIVNHWLAQQHSVTVIGRSITHIEEIYANRVTAITWRQLTPELFKSAEIVVNLAGANIASKRWTAERKKEVLASRIDTTKQIASLLAKLERDAPPLFNASAVGIYGLQPQFKDQLPPRLDENSPVNWEHPSDFLSLVGTQWEKAAEPAINQGVRVVFLRFGVVFAKEGGALPKLTLPFKFFLGGPIGTGNQAISWIAIDDVIRAIDFLISKPGIRGPVNIVAPDCVSEKRLSKTIANVIQRPEMFKFPAFLVNLLFGEMGRELLLEGQNVYPSRLLSSGYKFNYSNLLSALKHILA